MQWSLSWEVALDFLLLVYLEIQTRFHLPPENTASLKKQQQQKKTLFIFHLSPELM